MMGITVVKPSPSRATRIGCCTIDMFAYTATERGRRAASSSLHPPRAAMLGSAVIHFKNAGPPWIAHRLNGFEKMWTPQ